MLSPSRFPCVSLPQPHRTGTPGSSDLCFKGLVTGSPQHTQCSSSAPAVSEHGTTPPHCPSCPVAFPNTARSASKKQPHKPKTKPGAAARALSLVSCPPAPALGSGLNSCSPQTPPSWTHGWGEKLFGGGESLEPPTCCWGSGGSRGWPCEPGAALQQQGCDGRGAAPAERGGRGQGRILPFGNPKHISGTRGGGGKRGMVGTA